MRHLARRIQTELSPLAKVKKLRAGDAGKSPFASFGTQRHTHLDLNDLFASSSHFGSGSATPAAEDAPSLAGHSASALNAAMADSSLHHALSAGALSLLGSCGGSSRSDASGSFNARPSPRPGSRASSSRPGSRAGSHRSARNSPAAALAPAPAAAPAWVPELGALPAASPLGGALGGALVACAEGSVNPAAAGARVPALEV